MNLDQAIQTALAYEEEVRNIYDEGARTVNEQYARDFFQVMAHDEQRHVDYLEHKLQQWRETGMITVDHLDSVVPPKRVIRRAVNKLSGKMNKDARGMKEQQLGKALQVELETSRFYGKMVAELPAEGRELFAHFLEIEESHIEAVQFEMDYISNTGYWFNIKEFDME